MSYPVCGRHDPFIPCSGCQSAGLHTADDRGEAPCHADPVSAHTFQEVSREEKSRFVGYAPEEEKQRILEEKRQLQKQAAEKLENSIRNLVERNQKSGQNRQAIKEDIQAVFSLEDTEPVKVVTGVRRCGKSSLLKLMQEHLKNTGIYQNQIISMNFESMEYRDMDVKAFYHYVKERVLTDKKMYLFFDKL